jgi:hypothetical protein
MDKSKNAEIFCYRRFVRNTGIFNSVADPDTGSGPFLAQGFGTGKIFSGSQILLHKIKIS